MARTTPGPQRVTVLDLTEGLEIEVFRVVRTDSVDDPVLLNCFRSNYELGEEPRKVERTATVIHMGLSTYLDPGIARGTAQRWSALGDYVARVVLRHGLGFNIAQTGHPQHLTIWGDPVKLCEAVADIFPAEG
jgi:hypothetical protein